MQAKEQNISPIKQRILEFANTLGISKRDFYAKIGVSRGTLESKTGITEDVMAKFIATFPNISPTWLLTGKGSMMEEESNKLSTQPLQSIETRPRIPFDAAAGQLSIAFGSATEADCEQIPVIPTFPRYDFTIIARGNSMEPQYLSGDELACLFITDSSFIQWGRSHVLDTAQGVVVKRIFDNGNSILCKSNNPAYPDFSIPKADIYRMALVVGYIRIE